MEIQLPKRLDGKAPAALRDTKQITIIGANGSGKSRFCAALMEACPGNAFRVSALRALFPYQETTPLPGSIRDIFDRTNASNPQVTNKAVTEFDQLSYVMLIDEFRDLMNYKTRRLMGEQAAFPKTKLDTVVRVWQEVFPKNKVLRENGKLLFATEGHADSYPSLRLSDGEKAVLYYIGAVLYAMPNAVILVDDPETFIHHSIMHTLWNVIESIRPDCTFIYNTHDVDFASSRVDNQCVWVKAFDPEAKAWDYEVMPTSQNLGDALYFEILGSRKPILFVEGDDRHSLDSRLYPLIFPEYTVKPLGSCDKVIESVRSFSDLRSFHRLDSRGIVDRDRRNDQEVAYLRQRNIYVPDVAEIENLFMLEGVIRAVARHKHRDENAVFEAVKRNVLALFNHELKPQALEHVRHRVKRNVEMRIDMKFRTINDVEVHMVDLVKEINPRGMYDAMCREFHQYVKNRDYKAVLRVFNYKQMLGDSKVAQLCGFHRKDDYLRGVLNILKDGEREAMAIQKAVKECFLIDD
ncbi:MAG: DUF4435 domain-containing protein [Muribaculaceae bacterium]|nr:DUF4435 domain-containing protein [Muribaculaceae bacterium]